MEAYFEALQLPTEEAVYNAQGNRFDRNLIGARAGRAIIGWLRGEPLPAHTFPDPHTVMRIWQDMASSLRAQGLAPAAQPAPNDVWPGLQQALTESTQFAADAGRLRA